VNIEKRFDQIQLFLREYSDLINCEPLSYYPMIPPRFEAWINDIAALNTQEKLKLENDLHRSHTFDSQYEDFLKEIKKLQIIPTLDMNSETIPKELARKISQKKQHEILQIKTYLEPKKFKNITDIGSGAGHLSSILLQDNQMKSTCIDQEKSFQEIGKKKLQRFTPEILDRLTFKHATINPETEITLSHDSLLVGLHACGDLSVSLLKATVKNKEGALLSLKLRKIDF